VGCSLWSAGDHDEQLGEGYQPGKRLPRWRRLKTPQFPVSAGTIVADNGFRPDPDGFSFENYGNEGQKGLDAAEFERLYGPGVCISGQGSLRADPARPLPKNVEFDVRVDGSHLNVRDRETLSLVGPTYDATVEILIMAPHQEAHVALSPKGNAIGYLPSERTVSPAITLGAESKTAAYNATVAALGAPKGSAPTFVKEPKQQLMWFGDDTQRRRTTG
jgi:hypothetical protein